MLVGLALFAVGAWRSGANPQRAARNAVWIGPWLVGQVIIGAIGRYGDGARNILPNWIDIVVVIVFSLAIYYWAVNLALTKEGAAAAVAKDAQQLVDR